MNEMNPNMKIMAIDSVKHSLVKRDFCTAFSNLNHAKFLDPDNQKLSRIHFLLYNLELDLKNSLAYKKLMLECNRAVRDAE